MLNNTYKPIPGYSNYLIDPRGRVYNQELKAFLQGSQNPDGYFNVRIKSDEGITKTWGVHRLIGYVFIPCEKPLEDMVINHINGIKWDNRLENLEWVTYQENAEHAGREGLTSKCLPTLVRDVDTGEVTSYPSIISCALALGMTKDAIVWRVKSKGQRIFPERKQYMTARCDESWLETLEIDKELLKNGCQKAVLVRFLVEGSENEIREFQSLFELSKFLDVKLSTLSTWLSREDQPVCPPLMQFQWSAKAREWREVEDAYLEREKFTGQRCVVVWNEHAAMRYPSAISCAHDRGIKPTALNYRLSLNTDKKWEDGFKYKYYSDFIANNNGHSEQECLE